MGFNSLNRGFGCVTVEFIWLTLRVTCFFFVVVFLSPVFVLKFFLYAYTKKGKSRVSEKNSVFVPKVQGTSILLRYVERICSLSYSSSLKKREKKDLQAAKIGI